MCYIVHMKQITIRELHIKTGEWVRRVVDEERIVITDHGRPIATIVPFQLDDSVTPFSERKMFPEFKALPSLQGDSTQYISEDRDR